MGMNIALQSTNKAATRIEIKTGDPFWFKPDDRLTRLGLLKEAAR